MNGRSHGIFVPLLRRQRTWAASSVLFGTGLGALLGWLAVRGMEWSDVRRALGEFPVQSLLPTIVVLTTGLALRALRWRVLLIGERVSTTRLFLVQNAGIGLNSVSPLRVVSEPTQFGLLTLRDRLKPGAVLATMAVDRGMDLVVTLAVLSVAMMVFPPLARFAPYVAGAAGASLLGILLFVLVGVALGRLPWLQQAPVVRPFFGALRELGASPARLALALTLSFLYWGLVGTAGWLVLSSMGVHQSLFVAIVTVLAALFFSGSAPGLPGALGTFEFVGVTLLGFWDVPKATAFTWAAVTHLVLFLPSVLIAMVVLPREGIGSYQALHGLMGRWRERSQVS